MAKKSGIEGKMADPNALQRAIVQIICDSFSEWQAKNVIPATRWEAPVYEGPDPREEFHPRGLLKTYIKGVTLKLPTGESYLTCGIQGATGSGSSTPQDRTWIITQVLHRGWTSPKERLGGMRFPVWRSELQNPDLEISPPEGTEPEPDKAWIYISHARAQSGVTKNLFHVRAFEKQKGKFIKILSARLARGIHPKKIQTIRIVA